jgi:hypothetical protein
MFSEIKRLLPRFIEKRWVSNVDEIVESLGFTYDADSWL